VSLATDEGTVAWTAPACERGGSMSQLYDHHVAVGMTVYDTVGYTVGTVQAYNPQGGYLAVRTGGLFRRTDRSIPLDAVDHSGATGGVFLPRHGARQDVSLLLSQDDLTADRYNAPPIRGTRGMGGDGQRVPPTTRASDHACLRPRVPPTTRAHDHV